MVAMVSKGPKSHDLGPDFACTMKDLALVTKPSDYVIEIV